MVGDSAFGRKAMAGLAKRVTVTSRLRSNAVIHAPKPPPTGKRGQPRVRGARAGNPGEIATRAKQSEWKTISAAGRGEASVLVVSGLWYSVFGSRAVQVVIVRELADTDGYRIALISTDVEADAREIVARYADRRRSRSPSRTPSARLGSARLATASSERSSARSRSACSTRASPSPGTPCTGTLPPTFAAAASAHPGTPKSATPRCSTCSPRCDAS